MFGYVKPQKSELLVRQSEYYRAAYCGLCRSMRKRLGFLTSFSLSYDFAFLTVMRTAVADEKPEIEMKRCPAHPLKKRPSLKENDSCRYCASAAVLLTYRKIIDDLNDENGIKKLRAALIRPIFSRGRKKALRQNPELSELDSRLELLLSELAEIESQNPQSADAPAEIFGNILGEICAYDFKGSKKLTSYKFGKALGHWIYLIDAADDLGEDAEKGRYNPLIALYGKEMSDNDKLAFENALIAKLMEAEAAFDLMDMSDHPDPNGIIKNVLYLGLPSIAKNVLWEHNNKQKTVKENRLKGTCANERSI